MKADLVFLISSRGANEDVSFHSPSAAASVVMARASNGRKNWRVKGTGQMYGEWQEEKLAKAGLDSVAADADDE
jgi:hypothetical protein